MAFNIIGADGSVWTGAEAAADMVIGAVERGEMDPSVMGEIVGAYSTFRPQVQTALRPRINAIQARTVNPGLMASLRGVLSGLAPQSPIQPQPMPTAAMLREVVQGLDTGAVAIAAGAQAIITFNATMTFRPSRLMVGPAFAPLFTIDDLKVAADSLFLNTGSVPAEVFLPNAVTASAIKRRTAQAGTPLTILVTNVDVVAHRFRGALFGEALDQGSCP